LSKPRRSGRNDGKDPGQGFTPFQSNCPATTMPLMKNTNAKNNGGGSLKDKTFDPGAMLGSNRLQNNIKRRFEHPAKA
jgi:hypothetical protein